MAGRFLGWIFPFFCGIFPERMASRNSISLVLATLTALLRTCTGDAVGCADALGSARSVSTVYASAELQQPSAVAFNPADSSLYVTDHSTSSLLAIDYSAPTPTARFLRDRARYHYMAQASAIAFDTVGQYATCQESLNTYQGKVAPPRLLKSSPCVLGSQPGTPRPTLPPHGPR